jgi:DNA-binding NarL/FixJ family response regulator
MPPIHLSNNELAVVNLLAEGLSNKQIATRLDAGLRTVEMRRRQIAERLGIPTRMLVLWVGRYYFKQEVASVT